MNPSHFGLQFFLGVAPNFFAAMIIPLGVYWNYSKMENEKFMLYDKWMPFALVILFLIFILEEFKPIFGGSKHFDFFDILFSGIGVALFFIYYKTCIKRGFRQ